MSSETEPVGDERGEDDLRAEPPVRPGDLLDGKYEIGETLGRGGMGVVVAARHRELGKLVALKFLLRHDQALVARFLREGRAAATLTSEHTTRVLDVGRLASGVPYLVMEYLRGESVATRAARQPPATEDAVDWILQACEGLAEAHGLRIVHRDIKPANLFLTERADGTTLVKVLDFGISKVLADTHADPHLTTTGTVVGSPSYASPEQLTRPRAVDARADVWALGVTLYSLLAGGRPFVGETVPALYMRILAEAPTRPDARAPEVPRGLADVVMRCLEKEPDARFQDVAALAAALEPFAPPRARGAADRVRAALIAASATRAAPAPAAPAVMRAGRSEDVATVGAPAAAPREATDATELADPPFVAGTRWSRRRTLVVVGALATAGALALVTVSVARSLTASPTPLRVDAVSSAAAAASALAAISSSAPSSSAPPGASAPSPLPTPSPSPRPTPPRTRDPRSYR